MQLKEWAKSKSKSTNDSCKRGSMHFHENSKRCRCILHFFRTIVCVFKVKLHRRLARLRRARNEVPVVGLVGYTNAGKSTLLNELTEAEVLVEDKLFATLDPTTRRLKLPTGKTALLSDTVRVKRMRKCEQCDIGWLHSEATASIISCVWCNIRRASRFEFVAPCD